MRLPCPQQENPLGTRCIGTVQGASEWRHPRWHGLGDLLLASRLMGADVTCPRVGQNATEADTGTLDVRCYCFCACGDVELHWGNVKKLRRDLCRDEGHHVLLCLLCRDGGGARSSNTHDFCGNCPCVIIAQGLTNSVGTNRWNLRAYSSNESKRRGMSEGYKKSRKKGYAAVLKTAPAYTWGKASERLKGEEARDVCASTGTHLTLACPHRAQTIQVQAPGNITQRGTSTIRGLASGAAQGTRAERTELPGESHIRSHVEPHAGCQGCAWGQGRHNDNPMSCCRPGEYGIPRDPNMRQYPAFTFRGVTPKDAKAKLPGPGAYEPINPDMLSMRAR